MTKTFALAALGLTLALLAVPAVQADPITIPAPPPVQPYVTPVNDALDAITLNGMAMLAATSDDLGQFLADTASAALGLGNMAVQTAARSATDASNMVPAATQQGADAASGTTALLLTTSSDGVTHVQQLTQAQLQHLLDTVPAARDLVLRAESNGLRLQAAAMDPLPQVFTDTLNAVPQPDTPVASGVLIDVSAATGALLSAPIDLLPLNDPSVLLDPNAVIDVVTSPPDAVAIQAAVTDYAVRVAASPSAIVQPGGSYAGHVAGASAGFAGATASDVVGTSIATLILLES